MLAAMEHRAVLLLLLVGCSGHRAAPEGAVQTLEATLRVDPEPSAKHFQGVWLDRPGQPSLLAEYRALSCFQVFDGRAVTVTGEPWTPEPQAQQVMAPHVRIATLRLTEPSPDLLLASIGPEKTWTGVAETLAGEPGSKMEGSTWSAFTADGTTFQIWDSPADLPQDMRITVMAREVEVSPYAAGMTGPALCIRDFTNAD